MYLDFLNDMTKMKNYLIIYHWFELIMATVKQQWANDSQCVELTGTPMFLCTLVHLQLREISVPGTTTMISSTTISVRETSTTLQLCTLSHPMCRCRSSEKWKPKQDWFLEKQLWWITGRGSEKVKREFRPWCKFDICEGNGRKENWMSTDLTIVQF